MKEIRWDSAKSAWLKEHRGVYFEELIQAPLVAVKAHPGRKHQQVMLFMYQSYVWVVPYVETGEELFLKTAYPSRKFTKQLYKGDKSW